MTYFLSKPVVQILGSTSLSLYQKLASWKLYIYHDRISCIGASGQDQAMLKSTAGNSVLVSSELPHEHRFVNFLVISTEARSYKEGKIERRDLMRAIYCRLSLGPEKLTRGSKVSFHRRELFQNSCR